MNIQNRAKMAENTGYITNKLIRNVLLYVLLGTFAVIYLYPVYFVVISSLKNDFDIFYRPFSLPAKLIFENYRRAWVLSNISDYFLNSVLYTFFTCALLVIAASMASYVLAKFKFSWRNKIFVYFLAGMMVPFQSAMIPLAFVVSKLGLNDSVIVLILLMVAFGLPMNILIISGFMSSIPNELEESAIIDGCNVFYLFIRIIMPLSIPAIVTVTIMNFLATWNNYLMPLVFISDKAQQPLATGLLNFFGEKNSDYSGVMASIVISFIPPFLLFIFAQKRIEKSMLTGALKE